MGLNSNISNQFKKIFSLFSSKNFNEAEQLALKVIKKLDNSSPNNLSLLFNILGAINNHKKKFNKAILYYKKAFFYRICKIFCRVRSNHKFLNI